MRSKPVSGTSLPSWSGPSLAIALPARLIPLKAVREMRRHYHGMFLRPYFNWHNILLMIIVAAVVADVAFGLDPVLNAISIMFVVGSVLAIFVACALVVAIFFWITVGDLLEDIGSDRRAKMAWRWKFFALAGILGILVDGAIGAWNAYQEHILFSASVAQIPFSGVPVYLLMASYPTKWAEQYFMKLKANPSS